MVKEPDGVTFCKDCGLPVSLGATNGSGESVSPRHITEPGQPTECPEQK
ncbi:hypothetical protein [Streptomyces sp. NPDC001507]